MPEEERPYEEQERFCIEQIERLKQEYMKACEPWAERLEAIRRARGTRILVTREEAVRLGLITG